MKDYVLLSVIKVDRGMIPTSYNNGQPVMGRHMPYYAGLIIMEREIQGGREKCKRYYLDVYNSEIMLRESLGYSDKRYQVINRTPNLTEIMRENPGLLRNASVVVVKELNEYLKMENLIQLNRDAERMREIARCIHIIDI